MSKINDLLKIINEIADARISPRALPPHILKTILDLDPSYIEDGYHVGIHKNNFLVSTSLVCDKRVLKALMDNPDFIRIENDDDYTILVFKKK